MKAYEPRDTRNILTALGFALLVAVLALGCQGKLFEPGGGGPADGGDPGRVTMHRLNRVEYNNTVRDLLGTTQTPADDFPFDDYGYGFDNIADVLSLSPTQVELYQRAAEALVAEALAITIALDERVEAESLVGDNGAATGDAWRLTSNGEVATTVAVDTAGTYRIAIRAWGDQAGPDPARMSVLIDGAVAQTFDVTATSDAPATYELTAELATGDRRIAAAFINDYYEPDLGLDRNLAVDFIEVQGPVGGGGAGDNPLRDRIVICDPSTGRDCLRDILTAFTTRAWRRPVTAAELDGLLAVVDTATEAGDDVDTGLALALERVLLSPHFIFRVEIDPNPNGGAPHPLSDHELASRLSYFIWSSMPDDELFELAAAGELNDPEVIRQQVERMLADPKAEALVDNFAAQWLYLRGLPEHEPDYAVYPDYDQELEAALRTETSLLIREFLFDDLGADHLLTADFTYVNARLAQHYGLDVPGVGDEFQRVSLAGTSRAGLLTQGAILTVTSYPTRTSPVKRGKWVLEQLLCSEPPPPPPGVEGLPEDGATGGTIREQMERHRTDPVCASCHVEMDAIGFGLEHFDGVGAYRADYGDAAIDATGELSGSAFDGAQELGLVVSADPRFARCITEKMFTYALGRGPVAADDRYLDAITLAFVDQGFNLRDLIAEIATSSPFRYRRGEPTGGN